MKTTLVLDDALVQRLKSEARSRDMTMSQVVEAALRRWLDADPSSNQPPPIPTFAMGPAAVDIADRDALYGFMESSDVRR
jgi:Ribbon-helix-helix protein, copG family